MGTFVRVLPLCLLANACAPDDILPTANGCETDADCIQGTCINGTCQSGGGSSSSSSSSSGGGASSLAAQSSSGASTSMAPASSGVSSSLSTASSGASGSSGGAPQVLVHVRATEAVYSHTDGLAGQTPRGHVYGIRSFSLLRQRGDPAPVLVFDHGTDFVEAPLDDGADTVVGQATAASLPQGSFSLGRVSLSHVSYRVDSSMHANGYTLPGEFQNLHIYGDNVTLSQTTYQRGDYRFLFHSIAGDYTQQGANGPLPTVPAASGVTLEQEGEETVLYLPMAITTYPGVTADVNMYFTLNTHLCFRWQDQETAGYAADVFDSTPTGYEPILRFGANTYVITAE